MAINILLKQKLVLFLELLKQYKISIMKCQLAFLLTFLLSYTYAFSQDAPHWTKSSWRDSQYPSDSYLTGFSRDVKSDDETLSKATERVQDMARANLSKNVITEIQSVSESYAQSVEYGGNERLKKTFENKVKSESDAKINGVSVKSYYNENNDYMYAFAYASRDKVISYYKSKISGDIQKIESIMRSAQEFAGKSEKGEAEKEYEKCIPLFAGITYAQGLLQAVDKNASDSTGLFLSRSLELHKKLIHKLSEVQGTYICLSCSAVLFDDKTDILENKLKAAFADADCVFTSDTAKADFLIAVEASAREYNNAYNTYFSYVDANVDIKKAYNGEQIYQDEITQKGGSTKSYKSAAGGAYEDIIDKIAKKLMDKIK
ncbi:MAG: LPP20 family lipoprotein [bacterium]